jgi:excinuclease ABC subunit A
MGAMRLAESFEAALRPRHRTGPKMIAPHAALTMGYRPKEHLFQRQVRLPGVQLLDSELEPRLFSFNSPVGACPSCDGLGQQDFFDPARVVAFPTLSLASGAIKGWDRRNAYYFRCWRAWPSTTSLTSTQPFESLPEAVQAAILHGSGDEEIKFSYVMDSGPRRARSSPKSTPSRASCPIWRAATARPIRRWCAKTWRATAAPSLPRLCLWLAPAARSPPCQDWRGRRRPRAIFEISHATLRECFDYFQTPAPCTVPRATLPPRWCAKSACG